MRPRPRHIFLVAVLAAVLLVVLSAPAWASGECSGCKPWWVLSAGSRPSALPEGGTAELVLTAQDVGDAPTSAAVTLRDVLPAGLRVLSLSARASEPSAFIPFHAVPVCEVKAVSCVFDRGGGEVLPPFGVIEMRVKVAVEGEAATGALNTAFISGGGAAPASATHPIDVGGPEAFGFEEYTLVPEEPGGALDASAGSHPFQLTSVVSLSTRSNDSEGRPRPVALPKDITGILPPGLVGNPTPFAQCTDAQFSTVVRVAAATINECQADSAIGVATLAYTVPDVAGYSVGLTPIFNMVPSRGEPARFGFKPENLVPVTLDTAVHTGSDYAVAVTSSNITQLDALVAVHLTFWGVPGDPRHDSQRGWVCLMNFAPCSSEDTAAPPPFLVMPTSCALPFTSTVTGDSWAYPEHPSEQATGSYTLPEPLGGCNQLPFEPQIHVTPDGSAGSSPTGLSVDVHVPQKAALNAEGLSEASVKGIQVTLPQGLAINPAGGDGLSACGEAQVGFTGIEGETDLFTPGLQEPFCPDASKIGTVDIATPLLPKGQDITGAVYLATQNQNPFSSLIALYLVAQDPVSGTLVKLTGETHLTETGQIVATFKNSPELPFEDATLHFFGGERAPLASPAHCGAYTTNASFTPWSGEAGEAPHTAESTFEIKSGPNGTPCPGATLPFSPSLTAGTPNNNAGSFTPLVTTIGREDGQQNLQQVQIHFPPGVSGSLSQVKLCPEAQANEGTCGPESEIGETVVSAGVGSDPVSVTGGRVYITQAYQGAPFGLSIVNPVKAGPFDLEHDTSNPAQNPACDCVVVRGRLELDPVTAALTFTSDPSGPHAIPHLIDGIPVQIKKVNVTVNREHFTLNPTNCNPLSVTGTIASDEGASSPVSVPFQATNCAVLKYTPTLTVSTAGKASKSGGASLFFKIAYPKGAMGTQSWMREMKFSIPKQLPARLTTIQKACLAATFETNRAACPPASIIGHVVVHTPVLPVPLEGPLYFVSYGGAAFPDAVAVIKGYGVTIESHGKTFIDGKTGVTSATFESVPDVPFESIEVTVPQGPFSEFGANLPHASQSFCGQKLAMPILFKAQNGMEIHQNVPVGVTGCGKGLTRAQKLAAARKACRKKHGKRRAACEKAARKAFGALTSRKARRK